MGVLTNLHDSFFSFFLIECVRGFLCVRPLKKYGTRSAKRVLQRSAVSLPKKHAGVVLFSYALGVYTLDWSA